MKKFWELENGVLEQYGEGKNEEEVLCEQHFLKTYKRDTNGKYIVNMALKEDPACLGSSKGGAIQQLNSLYKRLTKQPECFIAYKNFLDEYLALGHMELVIEDSEPSTTYYLPHHAVYKDSTSTPVRCVFNGSALTKNGKSLNSLQYNGGTIQDNLFAIMLRFRTHRVAFIADIRRMYRAIWVDPVQRDLLRIVWKDGIEEPIKIYRLKTVTYGLSSSPYNATRVLQQLAIDEGEGLSLAAEVTKRDFYIDDVLSGARNVEEARSLKNELIELLHRGGMELHKWATNCPEIFSDDTEIMQNYDFCSETKTLGIQWDPQLDQFSFKLSVVIPEVLTKRNVLSQIAHLWDPLGVAGPLLTTAKVFMQGLWALKIGWDDPLPGREESEWIQFLESLRYIENIKVPRFVHYDCANIIEMHGFCDASGKAYGACIYLKCVDMFGNVSSDLLCSKSRVAPTKTISIPRLELSSALLLAQLYKRVTQALQFSEGSVFFWCDSSIVLAWLKREPCQLKVFVANRIAKIQGLTNVQDWRHVSTELNSADILSRGTNPRNLIDNKMWWHGPTFIKNSNFPESTEENLTDQFYEELKNVSSDNLQKTQCFVAAVTEDQKFLDYLLSLTNNYIKLLYICSYVLRFLFNICNPDQRRGGSIMRQELEGAMHFLVKEVQKEAFREEIGCLRSGKEIPRSSKLTAFNVFLDVNYILRIGGRIQNASISLNKKHPIVLPSTHKFTNLVINYYHLKYLHSGPQNLLFNIRNEFWPLNGRNLCRKIVRQCIVCFKNNPVVSEQLMGRLPRERINIDFVFNSTGLDFCGPFLIKFRGQRKGILHKVYICVFVCMVTKALHLEIVDDLSSEAFIASLKRFCARRGRPRKLFSDNATNYTGAHNEIKKLFKLVYSPDQVLHGYLTDEEIQWSFIPPRGAHYGGLWEAGVKSFKFYFKRIVGNVKLTYEELLTITAQIESMLNSHPLTPLSASIEDLDILTPGHFLVGRPLTTLAEPLLEDININRLNLWQKVTKYVQIIWKRWVNTYLSTLQQRQKWRFAKNEVKIGDMVILKEENLPPNKWVLGRIIELIHGKDGHVRVVMVKTQGGVLKRPISHICILPLEKTVD